MKKAYICDLSENVVKEAETDNGIIRFDIKPFEIVTLKII